VNPTLRRIAHDANPDLSLAAFVRFKRFVATGIMTEADVLNSLLASASIPKHEAFDTITRAFNAARRRQT
jgi:hypothetical protein